MSNLRLDYLARVSWDQVEPILKHYRLTLMNGNGLTLWTGRLESIPRASGESAQITFDLPLIASLDLADPSIAPPLATREDLEIWLFLSKEDHGEPHGALMFKFQAGVDYGSFQGEFVRMTNATPSEMQIAQTPNALKDRGNSA